jgi:ketosteroid isomerase-like protein
VSDTVMQRAASKDEVEIRGLIERWARAVREENREAIRADHDPGILMFDVPPPFLSRGLEAYMATWETFFACSEKPIWLRVSRCGGHLRPGRCICYCNRAVRQHRDQRQA